MAIYDKCACVRVCSVVSLCNLVLYAHRAPLSMGFTRQQYWSELPFLPPGDLHDPEIEPTSPAAD